MVYNILLMVAYNNVNTKFYGHLNKLYSIMYDTICVSVWNCEKNKMIFYISAIGCIIFVGNVKSVICIIA